MAINIDYGPIGVGLDLAAQAGQGDQRTRRLDIASRIMAMNLQRAQINAASDPYNVKAFNLQRAGAERMVRRDTPAASHVLTEAGTARANRAKRDADVKAQLDSMLQSGQIDNANYQKAMLGVLSGDDTLLTQAFAADKPAIANSQEVSIIRGRHTAKRRTIERSISDIERKLTEQSWLPEMAVKAEIQYGPRLQELRAELDKTYEAEDAEINGIRTKGAPGASRSTVLSSGNVFQGELQPAFDMSGGSSSAYEDPSARTPVEKPKGKPRTPALMKYLVGIYGEDHTAIKKWLSDNGYQVD